MCDIKMTSMTMAHERGRREKKSYGGRMIYSKDEVDPERKRRKE